MKKIMILLSFSLFILLSSSLIITKVPQGRLDTSGTESTVGGRAKTLGLFQSISPQATRLLGRYCPHKIVPGLSKHACKQIRSKVLEFVIGSQALLGENHPIP